MLWRQHYDTQVLIEFGNFDLTPILERFPYLASTGVWVCGASFEANIEMTIWWKLLKEDFRQHAGIAKVFVLDSVNSTHQRMLEQLVPRSEIDRAFLIEDSSRLISNLLKIDDHKRSFALILDQAKLRMAMIGPPTEDAWDQFKNQMAEIGIAELSD